MSDYQRMTNRMEVLKVQVRTRSDVIFSKTWGSGFKLFRTDPNIERSIVIENEDILRERLRDTRHDKYCVISFHQSTSVKPLQCTISAMFQIINDWNLSEMFLGVLLRCGDRGINLESNIGFREASSYPYKYFEIAYQVVYFEPRKSIGKDGPWAFRRTGVYHRHELCKETSRVILFNPNDKSVLQNRVEELVQGSSNKKISDHPLNIHLVTLSAYLGHWSDQNEYIANEVEKMAAEVFTEQFSDQRDDLNRARRFRYLESKMTSRVCRSLNSTRKIIGTLIHLNKVLGTQSCKVPEANDEVHLQLVRLDHQLERYLEFSELIGERIKAIIGLHGLRVDYNSDKLQRDSLELTSKSLDDSAAVRYLTVASMIYLPGTFIATLLGMNLFDFKSKDEAVEINSEMWIYFAATVPLTIVTVLVYFIFRYRHERKRKKENEKKQNRVKDLERSADDGSANA